MPDLIPADGYLAVFTGLDTSTGETRYHPRPLIAWTVDDDGRLVGHYVNANGQTALASKVPNFYRYMTETEWENFALYSIRTAQRGVA
ncbi:DUF6253 family protein [Streptomyces griseosporeus]